MTEQKTEIIYRLLNWATGAMLALGLYIANNALAQLSELDGKVDSHETRISILQVQ